VALRGVDIPCLKRRQTLLELFAFRTCHYQRSIERFVRDLFSGELAYYIRKSDFNDTAPALMMRIKLARGNSLHF
jgi:hypothetical protein